MIDETTTVVYEKRAEFEFWVRPTRHEVSHFGDVRTHIYSQYRMDFCWSNAAARKASRKNHTLFISQRKGSSAKPPTLNKHKNTGTSSYYTPQCHVTVMHNKNKK